eukprot:6459951-Amphidinium_carterae.1
MRQGWCVDDVDVRHSLDSGPIAAQTLTDMYFNKRSEIAGFTPTASQLSEQEHEIVGSWICHTTNAWETKVLVISPERFKRKAQVSSLRTPIERLASARQVFIAHPFTSVRSQ